MTEATLGLIRHALTFVGGLMVSYGYIDESTLSGIVGALVTVIGSLWSWMSKDDMRLFRGN